jgi:hypothetical protein
VERRGSNGERHGVLGRMIPLCFFVSGGTSSVTVVQNCG